MFQSILQQLVDDVPGSIGALFLDYEGETVEMLSERPLEADDHDLKVMGAYQGIFLEQLRAVCSRTSAGDPVRFKLQFENVKVLSCDLTDGYYLVLLVEPATNEGMAWHRLDTCRQRLVEHM